jgi:hypothetical protein
MQDRRSKALLGLLVVVPLLAVVMTAFAVWHLLRSAENVESMLQRLKLGSSVSALPGWPHTADQPKEYYTSEKRSRVGIVFPDGKEWHSESRVTFLRQKQGVLARISVTPMRHATKFSECVARVEEALKALEVADPSATKKLAKWKREDVPSSSPVSLGCAIDTQSRAYIEIRRQTLDDGWYVSADFTFNKAYRERSE